MGKMIVLTFADSEETAFQRAVSLLGGEFGVETVQPVSSAVLSFHGLEIRQHQRRVLRDRRDVRLTRLEYGRLSCLRPIPKSYSRSHKSLKLFGAWIVTVAIQALKM